MAREAYLFETTFHVQLTDYDKFTFFDLRSKRAVREFIVVDLHFNVIGARQFWCKVHLKVTIFFLVNNHFSDVFSRFNEYFNLIFTIRLVAYLSLMCSGA